MTIKWKNKIGKIGIALVLVTVLAVGLAVPAMAKGGKDNGSAGLNSANGVITIKGEVIDIHESTFDVQPAGGDEVTIVVDDNSRFYNVNVLKGFFGKFKGFLRPGHRVGQSAAFADLMTGDEVLVRVLPEGDENIAKVILIVKPSDIEVVKGEITDINGSELTITDAEGNETTLEWNEDTRIILRGALTVEEGQQARAVYNSETLVAKLINVRLEASGQEDEEDDEEIEEDEALY